MKKILITGANSYIGCSFEQYVKELQEQALLEDKELSKDKVEDKK